jgi:pyrroline-5-carboxylate reductase
MKVLVLGAGKMIEGILFGLKKTNDLSQWSIYTPSGVSAQKLAAAVGAQSIQDLKLIQPDWILVGCKPQQLKELNATLSGLFSDALYVSVLAAASEADQIKTLGIKKLIRFMPNLAVRYNAGISLLSSTSAKNELPRFQSLFSSIGEAIIVQENELDELTLLTGSGPAFFYEFALRLSESFTSLDQLTREKLVRQVLIGSAETVKTSSSQLSNLIDAVTSKGGVTIVVLENWRFNGMSNWLKKGIEAGRARTADLKALILRN